MSENTFICDYNENEEKKTISLTGNITFFVLINNEGKKELFLNEELSSLSSPETSVIYTFYLKLLELRNNQNINNFHFYVKDNELNSEIFNIETITVVDLKFRVNKSSPTSSIFEGSLNIC